MKKNNGHLPRRRRVMDYATAAIEQMEFYCAAHPGSPSAVRRPRLLFRSELWIAVLGPTIEEGIVGIGPTVAAALRAFDAQYFWLACVHRARPQVKPARCAGFRKPSGLRGVPTAILNPLQNLKQTYQVLPGRAKRGAAESFRHDRYHIVMRTHQQKRTRGRMVDGSNKTEAR